MFTSENQKLLYLPRTMDAWPWPRAINPHYREIQAQSDAWFHSFQAFTPQSQRAYDKCDFGTSMAVDSLPFDEHYYNQVALHLWHTPSLRKVG